MAAAVVVVVVAATVVAAAAAEAAAATAVVVAAEAVGVAVATATKPQSRKRCDKSNREGHPATGGLLCFDARHRPSRRGTSSVTRGPHTARGMLFGVDPKHG